MTTALVDKSVALVLRAADRGQEVLVFTHPWAGVQVPKGTVEPGEAPAQAALRELHEESGLVLDGPAHPIGTWERDLGDGEIHRWHLFAIVASTGLPDRWTHVATGSIEEEGLAFAYRWLPVDPALPAALDPLFGACARSLLAHLATA